MRLFSNCSPASLPAMGPQVSKDVVLTVAFALGRCRAWLREMIKPHNGDEARMQAAEAIVRQIERSNFR